MDAALLVGLASALAWGTSAYLGALAARRVGGWLTNMATQVVGMLIIVPLAVPAFAAGVPAVAPWQVVALGCVGVATVAINVVAYELLRRAPVALLYPILASNGAVVTVLAIVILGERLEPLQVVAFGCISLGVGAIAYRRGAAQGNATADALEPLPAVAAAEVSAGPTVIAAAPAPAAIPAHAPLRIVLLAVGVMLSAGVVLFVVASLSKPLGWYLPVALDRTVQSGVVLGALAFGFPPRASVEGRFRDARRLLIATGLLDGIGVAFYGLANNVGPTAIASIAVSTFAVIPVVLGIVLLHERPQPHQSAGIGAVIGGLVLLAAA